MLNGTMKKRGVVRIGGTALVTLKEYIAVKANQAGQLFLSKPGKAIRPSSIGLIGS